MVDEWLSLAADIPRMLSAEWDNNGEVVWPCEGEAVQLRDAVSGQRILFYAEGRGVGVSVSVPSDPVAAVRLRSVLRSQRTTSLSLGRDYRSGGLRPIEEPLWRPLPGDTIRNYPQQWDEHAQEWQTGWRHTAGNRDEFAVAIVAVIRDGLGSTSPELSVSAYNDYGPTRTPCVGTVPPGRPTARGMAPRCGDWDELAERLEWVLSTLPLFGTVNVSIPGSSLFVQLGREEAAAVHGWCLGWQEVGLPRQEVNGRMRDLGWLWAVPPNLEGIDDTPNWLTPPAGRGTADPTVRHMVTMAIETLRAVGGVDQPARLAVDAFCNLRGGDDMSYVSAELGLRPA
ncbi:hypothetical protein [Nocardia sp. NPDC060259]|uniref:TY-Chap domain-containing protein n=1 Tax=Nocardia sp. NPDC060259 TaxID=3347088 RepID=UPI0036555CEC